MEALSLRVEALVELELSGTVFRQEGEVKCHLDEVALGGIVGFILIIILNVGAAVLKGWSEVLEVVEVLLVGKNVVAVSSVHVAVLHLGLSELGQGLVKGDLHAEHLASVFFLLDGPVAVIVINSGEVVIKILIDLEISNCQDWNDCDKCLVYDVTEHCQYQ